MILCIKYQTCWKYSKYSCHIVTSCMCLSWTINSHYVLLCNISLMSGSSWATSYIMSNCRHRKKRKQLSLWSWLRLNSRDDTEKQSTLFPVVDTKNRLWLKMGTLDFSLQANCETLLASLDVHISKSEKHLVFSFLKKRDEEDNGEGIRETRWLIYCFAAFKAKLLQNSALRTSRCFRPFTILK